MAGKLTTILAKREAEVYCTHGLHQEALRLYHRVLASSPNIDQNFKHAIENHISAIEAQLKMEHPDEQACISARDIIRLKEGWGPEATVADLMVCAQAFYRIGHFRSALSELVKLMEKRCDIKGMTRLFADCLAGMCPPQRLLETIERLTRKIFTKKESRLVFLLELTEKMAEQKHPAHALALFNSLKDNSFVRTKTPHRLSAVARRIEALDDARLSH